MYYFSSGSCPGQGQLILGIFLSVMHKFTLHPNCFFIFLSKKTKHVPTCQVRSVVHFLSVKNMKQKAVHGDLTSESSVHH